MKEINQLPDFDWTERAQRQIDTHGGNALLAASHKAYRLGNAGVIGLIYQSMFSPPWLWFALAKTATMRDFIDFRRMQELIPRGTLTAVEDGDEVAFRFARFYGFEDSGNSVEHEGQLHLLMRKA
jgi:hypothetical protein